MRLNRREFLPLLASILVGCSSKTSRNTDDRDDDLAESASHGRQFLLQVQGADGAWRSDRYATFKDGTALTPLALDALRWSPHFKSNPAVQWLTRLVGPDGSIRPPEEHGFDYPIYTAALAVLALDPMLHATHEDSFNAWVNYVRQRQLTEELGWSPDDLDYGGWGYSHGIPFKPKPRELVPPLIESNLSATTFALRALAASGASQDDHALVAARRFVHRCQNFDVDDPEHRGGFFFMPRDPVRNKAGVTDQGLNRSYGSATADGFNCLTQFGDDDGRLDAARSWLTRNLSVEHHPGTFPPGTERQRDALFFYYAASLAQTRLGAVKLPTSEGLTHWRLALADALIDRQHSDGSWSNEFDAFREDEPILATCYALAALRNLQ